MTETNRLAWNANRFDTWTAAFGGAEAEAARIVSNPRHTARRIVPYIGPVAGRRICNVQGSHGRIAVALALLGASVQVIDFSDENRRFANDLASKAGTTINYAVCDIMDARHLELPHKFDTLVLELGILHYHQDLDRFFAVMRYLLADNGALLLNEFHPVQRKLYWDHGPHHYFHDGLIEADVPNPDPTAASLGRCQYRFWTMGEIVTAAINAGFIISQLNEHPDGTNPSIPGSFTLLAHAAPAVG